MIRGTSHNSSLGRRNYTKNRPLAIQSLEDRRLMTADLVDAADALTADTVPADSFSINFAKIEYVASADGVADIAIIAETDDGTYLEYKLDPVFIKSWSISGDADDRPTEEVAFYYNKIALSYTATDDGKVQATDLVLTNEAEGILIGLLRPAEQDSREAGSDAAVDSFMASEDTDLISLILPAVQN